MNLPRQITLQHILLKASFPEKPCPIDVYLYKVEYEDRVHGIGPHKSHRVCKNSGIGTGSQSAL